MIFCELIWKWIGKSGKLKIWRNKWKVREEEGEREKGRMICEFQDKFQGIKVN